MSSGQIDVLIAYVDSSDPQWIKQLESIVGNDKLKASRRFRQFGLLETQLKLIRCHMPFIKDIYVACAFESQAPSFLEDYGARAVFHRDFIPQKHLPTFSANTIEMFMPCIEQLSEKFVYFNDDMFPVQRCCIDDFFKDGQKPVFQTFKTRSHVSQAMWHMMVKNSWNAAVKHALDAAPADSPHGQYRFPWHHAAPYLKSSCLELMEKMHDEIDRSCSKFRFPFNFTQYLYADYMLLTGKVHEVDDVHFRYYRMTEFCSTAEDFLSQGIKTICVNDMLADIDKSTKAAAKIKAVLESTLA